MKISCIKGANLIGIVFIAVIIGHFIVTERKTSNKWNALQGMKGWWNLIMMTRRKAIEALEYLISGECTDTQMDYVDEIQMAITDMKICEANNAGWISVKDRLPPRYHMVLITGKNCAGGYFGVIKGSHDGDKGQWYRDDIGQYVDSRGDTVTHWMPLPEPPKEET